MVELKNISFEYMKENFKNGDIISLFLKDKKENKTYLIDCFKIDIRNIDIIDLFNQFKEIYFYNKEEENEIYYSRLFKEEEIKSVEYMKSKNIIILK